MPMQLYEHQGQALKQTKGFNRVAYYLDMGLGKTFVGSEKMKQLGTDTNIDFEKEKEEIIRTIKEEFGRCYMPKEEEGSD